MQAHTQQGALLCWPPSAVLYTGTGNNGKFQGMGPVGRGPMMGAMAHPHHCRSCCSATTDTAQLAIAATKHPSPLDDDLSGEIRPPLPIDSQPNGMRRAEAGCSGTAVTKDSGRLPVPWMLRESDALPV